MKEIDVDVNRVGHVDVDANVDGDVNGDVRVDVAAPEDSWRLLAAPGGS